MSNAQVRGDSYESGCLGRTGKGTLSCECICWLKGFISRKSKVSSESLFRTDSDYLEIFFNLKKVIVLFKFLRQLKLLPEVTIFVMLYCP